MAALIPVFLIRRALRLKIVHSIPGRLRVHIPAIKYAPESADSIQEQLIRLIKIPDGIRTVESNNISGNLVIEFDINSITNEGVIDYLSALLSMVSRYYKRLSELPSEKISGVLIRLESVLKESIESQDNLTANLKIPDHVWS